MFRLPPSVFRPLYPLLTGLLPLRTLKTRGLLDNAILYSYYGHSMYFSLSGDTQLLILVILRARSGEDRRLPTLSHTRTFPARTNAVGPSSALKVDTNPAIHFSLSYNLLSLIHHGFTS